MKFKEGGYWHYAWGRLDYLAIRPIDSDATTARRVAADAAQLNPKGLVTR